MSEHTKNGLPIYCPRSSTPVIRCGFLLDIKEMAEIVRKAKADGLIWVVKEELEVQFAKSPKAPAVLYPIICGKCNNEFKSRNYRMRYCNDCRTTARVCVVCSKHFEAVDKNSNVKTCGEQCRHDLRSANSSRVNLERSQGFYRNEKGKA